MPDASVAFDAAAEFEQILFERLSKFRRIAFRYLDNSEDAQDAVQDALLSAFRHASEFQHRSQLSTWLHRIVVNSALMKLRTRRRHDAASLDEKSEEDQESLADQLVSCGPSPQRFCERAELREILSASIRDLPPRQRQAFLLCMVEGNSLHDAAQKMEISESALKCSLVRARRNLRKPLEQRLHRSRPLAGPAFFNRESSGLQRASGVAQPPVFSRDRLDQTPISPKQGTAEAA